MPGRYATYPSGGRPVLIHLTVRRYLCANAACESATFGGQADRLTARYQRWSGCLSCEQTGKRRAAILDDCLAPGRADSPVFRFPSYARSWRIGAGRDDAEPRSGTVRVPIAFAI